MNPRHITLALFLGLAQVLSAERLRDTGRERAVKDWRSAIIWSRTCASQRPIA
jgi:hypothetical protein